MNRASNTFGARMGLPNNYRGSKDLFLSPNREEKNLEKIKPNRFNTEL